MFILSFQNALCHSWTVFVASKDALNASWTLFERYLNAIPMQRYISVEFFFTRPLDMYFFQNELIITSLEAYR